METIATIVFFMAVIGFFLFFFSFPLSLGVLDNLLHWRRTKANAALPGQVGKSLSDFTTTLAGTVATGQVEVVGNTYNAKCKSANAGHISKGDPVEITSVEGRSVWVKKSG